jgi:sec-independent protein translocase protein TatB
VFDIGFSELALVLVVALMIIGPDKLPGLARTAGLWLGKAQAIIKSVKADIGRELAAEKQNTSNLLSEFHQIAEEAKCNFHMDASGKVETAEPQRADQSPRNAAAQ